MSRFLAALLAVSVGACEAGQAATDIGSNTNWLRGCETAGDCGGSLDCRCGICTLGCDVASDCAELGRARCAGADDPAAWTVCGREEPTLTSGICLPSCDFGTCAADRMCVEGACVPAALPPGAFCAPVAERNVSDRTHEDELLALVQTLRTSGGELCGGTEPSAPVSALRVDPRLLCAARVLAVDLATTGNLGLVDSSGRTSEDRLALAGYDFELWTESYGRGAGPRGALDAMLSDADVCARLVASDYLEVGVGRADETSVVTLATPR